MKDKLSNANFPKTEEGRVYHVEVKRGEVANRIITVGDSNRAKLFIRWLDKDVPVFQHTSNRGFFTLTGKYKGVPVSVIGIGMGLPMMDFFVREIRAITDGPLIIIRFGSCGTIGKSKVGDMVVPRGAFAVIRNFDYFLDEDENAKNVETEDDFKNEEAINKRLKDSSASLVKKTFKKEENPYNLSKVFYADPEIYELLQRNLLLHLPPDEIHTGLNASCDSFYSSQGRMDENFTDNNQELIKHIIEKYTEVESLEMETFMLYHLAKCSTNVPLISGGRVKITDERTMKKNGSSNEDKIVNEEMGGVKRNLSGEEKNYDYSKDVAEISSPFNLDLNTKKTSSPENSIRAAAIMMVFTDRKTNEFIDPDRVNYLEPIVGQMVLDTLVSVKSDEEHVKSENASTCSGSDSHENKRIKITTACDEE